MFFWTLKADCQNCVFICPDKLFLETFYSWKNVHFDSFFQNGGRGWRGFQNFVEKTVFWRKFVRGVIRTGLNVSRATFWGKTRFSGKFLVNKFFQKFSIVLVFCRFLAYLSEKRPCVQMKLLKKFFKQINVHELFSKLEQNFVLCQQYSKRLSNLRFICLHYFFHGDFFTWRLISSWITFPEIKPFVFVKVRSKITYPFWKVSAWLSKLDSTNLERFF